MIYLASPYTSGSEGKEEVLQRRYELTKKFVAQGIDKNIYSPIVYYHDMAKEYDFPKEHAFWDKRNKDILRRCDEVWVLDIPNEEDWRWDKSKGVESEVTLAMACGIPIVRALFYTEDRPLPPEFQAAMEEAQQTEAQSECPEDSQLH